MSLSSNQALEAAKNPPNQAKVLKGEKYESRLRILTQAYSAEDIEHQSAWKEVKTYLYNTLTTDKYNAVLRYFTFPLSVVNISNDIMTDIYTVFNGRNPYFDTIYPNERFKENAQAVVANVNIKKWIEHKGKEVLKCMPNSITVIDINEKGEPILILVPNGNLLGYEFKKCGSFDYVVFEHSYGDDWKRIAVYDDEYYRVYLKKDNGSIQLEIENPHNLGYCPAKFFYDKPLNNKHDFDRCVPLSNVMGVMSQWQLMDTYIYYADHYSSFPVMEYADNECTVEGCNNGEIDGEPILNDANEVISYTLPKPCPNCAKKGLIGPGTAVGIEVSEDADIQDTRGVLSFIAPDVGSLEYAVTKQVDRENFIKINTVGYNNITTKEAVNEQQIKFLAESRSKTPREISEHLSDLYIWIVQTIHNLIYDTSVMVNASFGTEFLVLSEKDLMLLIQEAKKAGVQSSIIADLNKQLIETKYKTQPNKVAYMSIASDLEPSPFDTKEEVKDKFASGMITPTDYYIKLNFFDLIRRFERENGSIVTFGVELPYDQKINRIKDTLIFYTNQNLESNGNDTTEPTETGGTGATDN
jgi:hypothetical protein